MRGKASFALELAALAAPPVFMAICAAVGLQHFALFSLIVVAAALLMLLMGYDRSRPRSREIVPIAVLAALAVAGRILFAAIPSFKPVSAITIIAGILFGRRSGFMVGALAGLVSNFFFGQGPWTPWQMYAWGLIGYLAGVLAQTGLLRHRSVVLVYGFASGLLYGLILNLWSIVGFFHPQYAAQLVALLLAAAPLDAIHGVATVVFLAVLFTPWQRKLERVKLKYGFGES